MMMVEVKMVVVVLGAVDVLTVNQADEQAPTCLLVEVEGLGQKNKLTLVNLRGPGLF